MTLLEFITASPRSYAECIAFARERGVTWETLDRRLDELEADGKIKTEKTQNGLRIEVRK